MPINLQAKLYIGIRNVQCAVHIARDCVHKMGLLDFHSKNDDFYADYLFT